MPTLLFLFYNPLYLEPPNGLVGWLGWLSLFGLVILLQHRWWGYHKAWNRKKWGILALLIALVPLTSLVLPGIRFSPGEILPPPMLPKDPAVPALMIFAAVPWVLAGGLLGPGPAAALAVLSGLLLALFDTHNPFLPLELAFFATLFSAAVHQPYRTPFYSSIRHPFIAAVLLALLYPVLLLLDSIFVAQGILANRLDYAITYLVLTTIAVVVSLLVAGLVAQVIAVIWPRMWGYSGPLHPSPAEKRLEARFLYSMAPLAIILAFTLMVGDWIVAGSAARRMLEGRMANAAQMAVDSVPFFMETGQNLISQIAENERLLEAAPVEIERLLDQEIRKIPYFSQLILVDNQGVIIASYPPVSSEDFFLAPEEQAAIRLAGGGVYLQNYAIPPREGSTTAQISFLAAVLDDQERVQGLLIGHTDLSSNPFGRPLLTSLESMATVDGQGVLLDGNGRILHHPDGELVMTAFTGYRPESALFYNDNAPDGTRQFVYHQPVQGSSWSVLLAAPARYAQQQALNIAAPLLGMILVLSFIAVALMRIGLGVVTASLHNLAGESDRMAGGQLDRPLQVNGEDEVGQLGRAFEKMRAGLKARMDELNRLLLASQGVASSLEIESSLQAVLEAALVTGASSARVVLAPEVVPEAHGVTQAPSRFGNGPASELYSNLDGQILSLVRQQDQVILTNLARPRLLVFSPGLPRPNALLAIALRREHRFYGTLWVAHDQSHQFSEDEVRFLVTLAGHAALAASNARLFLTAEVGRQRLEAILASTPDPVLVTDQDNHLLLANPAAWQVLGLETVPGSGQQIEDVVSQAQLIDLLRSPSDDKKSAELLMPDGKIYLATTSLMMANGQRMGRVCVLRDVTHFKELDALKSEFVSTVSHDLRSPLTLIRGYTTMLQMVGELNEQQSGYVQKIVSGVESMSRLVNNLLDLGRIEAGVGLQLEMVPADEVVERVIGALQLQAAQKRIQLSSDIPQENIPRVEADQALLEQVLHNLIENAIKYTDTDGEVKVHLQVCQNEMVFEVRDNGIGIAAADQQRLFEKFYRATFKASKRQRGSGLGLAIVKSIAERHGGRVWVESQLGKGSTFYLALPLRQRQPHI